MTMENLTNNIQNEVQTALLQDRQTRDYGIEVVDNNGIITLKGTVPTNEASERAETITRDIPGVRSVINELYIRSSDTSNE
jgi:osmotically-inducible protein OsmY